MSEFEVGISNCVYEVNVSMSSKILNNVKSCTPLNILTLISDYKMYIIHFI